MLKGYIMSDKRKARVHGTASFEGAPEANTPTAENAASEIAAATSCCTCPSTPVDAEADTLPDEEILYDLADLFKVFADTTRIKILYCLMGKQLCVADIAETVCATQSAVSHQLRILKQAHLVKFRRDGKNVIYELSDDHVYTMLSQGMTHLCE